MSEIMSKPQKANDTISKEKKGLGLYFHIPFCVRKCLYCDFLSAPCGRETQTAYMEALLRETKGRAETYGDYTVKTIFIGGGTPSVVETEWIEKLLTLVRERYKVLPEAEVTIEVNPGTVDFYKLTCYRSVGINRLSIGLQSANDRELKRLGRIHTFAQFQDTYSQAIKAGFDNINVDLMSALPEQSLADYEKTLQTVLGLNPQPSHISAYSLIVEEGTAFAELERNGKLFLPNEDCEREMYEKTEELLREAGFRRYEISNYAKNGFECRHNCGYWKRHDYAGYGIGAASLIDNKRFSNKDSLEEYIKNPMGCSGEIQELTVKEQMEEFMFLGLRLVEGVSALLFERTFGKTLEQVYGEVIRRNVEDGLLYFHGKEMQAVGSDKEAHDLVRAYAGNRLALTGRGLDVSNYVMAQFLLD